MRKNGVIHHLGHENHGLKMKSYELMHQIAFLQKQIAIMQKTYHTHYTNHANTVAHLQHKNAELNKALVIDIKPPPALPQPPPPGQKSLEFYSRDREHDRDHWCHHHHHCHHPGVDNGFYDNGDHLMDEDHSLRSDDHVPLLPIPQHQYSFVSVDAPIIEMKSVEMDHPGHPPIIPPPGPLPPTPPPNIPPQGPSLPLMPPPPIPSTTMLPYIPQKKRMSLVL
jgi:hypothetical protein